MVLELILVVFMGACVVVAQHNTHAGVDPDWSYNMVHALALDVQTWPRGDVFGLGLTNEDVSLLRE